MKRKHIYYSSGRRASTRQDKREDVIEEVYRIISPYQIRGLEHKKDLEEIINFLQVSGVIGYIDEPRP